MKKNKLKLFLIILSSMGIISSCSNSLSINYSKSVNNRNNSEYTSLYKEVCDGVVVFYNYQGKQGKLDVAAIGSGFIYDQDNNYYYLLTNEHVVENSIEMHVVTNSGQEEKAEIINKDALQDICVLRILKTKLNDIKVLETSTTFNVGDEIFTIGCPATINYRNTLNVGVIAGKDRYIRNGLYSNIFSNAHTIQLDCAINPGNSGGPLFNKEGKVIGINTLKLSSDGRNKLSGLNFALYIEDVLDIASKIRSKGYLYKNSYRNVILDGYNFCDISEVPLYTRRLYGIDESITQGLFIQTTNPRATYKTGSVIYKVDDKIITSTEFFKDYIFNYEGNEINIGIYINDGTKTSNELQTKLVSVINKEVN